MKKNSVREKVFKLTQALEKPLDLLNHLPFRIAVISNLLAFNRDWKIRNMCNLEPRELRIFINIGSYMPIKAADIAYQSRLDSYTVSRAVKKLQSAQLIEIEADITHKNIKNLMLSERGKALYESLVPALEERSEVLESVLTKQERILFYSMLEKVENKAEQILAEQALAIIKEGGEPPADQKEIIRWYRKGQKK
ncbi:MAG: MarR family winged helix-turn-helix transcriptional regulator [Oceanospirillaceae bacterium]